MNGNFMKKAREFLAFFLAAALFVSISYFAGGILMPHRVDYGSTWHSYLKEDKDTIDVLVFGSSIAYCDVVPAVIWKNTGVTAYVMSGPEQTLPMTYYYVREACRTQSPEAIFIEVSGIYFTRYEDYTKVNIGYMPWTANRIEATFDTAEKGERPGLLFPMYNYHGRVFEIGSGEIESNLNYTADTLAGYTLLTEHKAMSQTQYRDYSSSKSDYDRNMQYVGKIAQYCQDKGIRLYLYLAPAKEVPDPERLKKLKSDLLSLPIAGYVNFNDTIGDIGFDDSTDWYDTLHLNVSGAKKFSAYLADYLTDTLALKPGGRADTALWRQRADYAAGLSPDSGS